MVGLQRFEVDSIQTRLSRCAGSEKISIDSSQITIRIDDNQAQNAEGDNPRIVQDEKVYRLPHGTKLGLFHGAL